MKVALSTLPSLVLLFLFYHHKIPFSRAQLPTNTTGYACNATAFAGAGFPCQTYAFYRANPPDFLDLAVVGDLFSVSRRMIAIPSNISSPSSPLLPGQSLFVPLTCSCNSVNFTLSLSYANLSYTIQAGNTFYVVSTTHYQNLTTYQSVEAVNPDLVPTDLQIGQNVIFPIFCKCPNRTQLQNGINFLISYVFQPLDSIASIASRFGTTPESIIDVNGRQIVPSDTVFVPVSRLPNLTQPIVAPVSPSRGRERTGVILGLAIGLGICGLLLIIVGGFWVVREAGRNRRRKEEVEIRDTREGGKGMMKMWRNEEEEVNLMADVSGCLDKYRVFRMEELEAATNGFDQRSAIQGSVYRGCIDGEFYAIKKMKWNAYEELKILQKVNHGNLVKLEGFCIDSQEVNCFLVYEYVENGSLHSWLHGDGREKLSWRMRLRIAIDVANGLQYIHEHTTPRVVHKDIKSSNILLDSNLQAKIANFGLAKSGLNAITAHIVGTQGYVAPEYVTDGVVSTKMDVFSFGVVLLELVSGREAVDEEGRALWMTVRGVLDGDEAKDEEKLKGFVDEVLLGESCSIESIKNAVAIAVTCLSRDPSRRPSMVDVAYALRKSDNLFVDLSEDSLSPRYVVAR